MKVSIVVPTYNRANLICQTIDSLMRQNYPKDSYEIIVVDNNSSDSTLYLLSEYVKKIKNTGNLVIARELRRGDVYARNSGAALANGEYLLFTDDDAIFDSNWISSLVKILDDHPQVAMVGSRIEILWDEQPPSWVKQYEYLLGKISKGDEGYIISSKGFCIPNGSLAVRKSLFCEIGGNNPGQVGEWLVGNAEVGLFHKIKQYGYLIGFTDDTTMWHLQFRGKNGTMEDIIRRLENCAISDAYTDVVERNVIKYRDIKCHKRSILKNLLMLRLSRLRRAYFQYKLDVKYNEFVDKYSDQTFIDSIKIEDCVLNDKYFVPPVICQASYEQL